jgi:hypothetical protein
MSCSAKYPILGMGPGGAKPTSIQIAEAFQLAFVKDSRTQPIPFDPSRSLVPVLVPRIRTIGVRLSEEEHSALEKFCVESGARSISDVARTAICDFVKRAKQRNVLFSAANAHSAQVRDLERKLEQLIAEIALLKGRKTGEGTDEPSSRGDAAK